MTWPGRALLAELLQVERQAGNPWGHAMATLVAGRLAMATGDLAEARARIEEVIGLFRQMGDLSMANHARVDLAHVLRRHGDLDQAEAQYQESLRTWQHLGQRGAVAHVLESLAMVALARGRDDRAARLLGAAEALRDLSGAQRMGYERAEYDSHVAALRAALDPARLDEAWAAGRAMSLDAAIEITLSDGPRP